MFKDLLIVFLVCLLITAFTNATPTQNQPAALSTSTSSNSSDSDLTISSPSEELTESASATADTSDETFEEDVIASNIPVLVDFSTPGCVPCKMMAPILDSLAKEYEGRLKILNLDCSLNRVTSEKYNVHQYPTLILFSSGRPAARNSGTMSKDELASVLNQHLNSKAEAPPALPDEEKELN